MMIDLSYQIPKCDLADASHLSYMSLLYVIIFNF